MLWTSSVDHGNSLDSPGESSAAQKRGGGDTFGSLRTQATNSRNQRLACSDGHRTCRQIWEWVSVAHVDFTYYPSVTLLTSRSIFDNSIMFNNIEFVRMDEELPELPKDAWVPIVRRSQNTVFNMYVHRSSSPEFPCRGKCFPHWMPRPSRPRPVDHARTTGADSEAVLSGRSCGKKGALWLLRGGMMILEEDSGQRGTTMRSTSGRIIKRTSLKEHVFDHATPSPWLIHTKEQNQSDALRV